MYCPNCSRQTVAKEKFCRSCGMNLQVVSQEISEHLNTVESGERPVERIDIKAGEREREQLKKSLALAAIAAILAISVQVGHMTGPAQIPFIILMSLLLLRSVFVRTGFAKYLPKFLNPPTTLPKRQSPQAIELPPAATTSDLLSASQLEPMVSITEPTTRTLEPALRQKPRDDE